jgi:hypothetical protein
MITLFLCSCENNAIDGLSGKYPIPKDITLSTVKSLSDVKSTDGSKRYFTVQLTGANNEAFTAQFCCSNTWYLEARTYTMATASTAIIGNFVSDNTSYSNGSSAATISDASITVSKADNLAYSIDGVLVMSDKSVIRVHFNGKLNYIEPQPEKLTQVLMAKATAAASYTTIELILGTDGLSAQSNGWGTTIAGTGDYADISLICSSSTLASRTYTPAVNGSEAIGNFTAGYLGQYQSWSYDAGSRWYSVNNNVASAANYLTTGAIKVALSGSIYTITIDSGSTFAQYTGTITVN